IKIREIDDEINVIKAKLQRITDLGQQRWVSHIYILPDLPNLEERFSGEIDFAVSYMMANAKWHPRHDVRAELDKKNGLVDITLVTSGQVEQHSGENWQDVDVILSALDPLPLYLPKLNRWAFKESREEEVPAPQDLATTASEEGRAERQRISGKRSMQKLNSASESISMSKDSVSEEKMMAPAAPQQMDEALVLKKMKAEKAYDMPSVSGLMQDQKQDSGALVTFNASARFPLRPIQEIFPELRSVTTSIERYEESDIQRQSVRPGMVSQAPAKIAYSDSSLPAVQARGRQIEFKSPFKLSVKSDDPPVQIPVHSQKIKGKIEYLVIPKQDKRVFVRAETINTTDKPILQGSTQIFMGGDLVMKTELPTIAEGNYFVIDLGVDSNIEAKRIVEKKAIEKGMIFKDHSTEVTVKIQIANHHNFPIKVAVKDNYPLSPTSDIKVELQKVEPDTNDKKNGLIEWNRMIEAKQIGVFKFIYKVTHPEKYLVSEFN
ncbi:MAG: DUF4139 domain-containing protein, partial [Bdellovibrionota bacterium]